MISKNFEKCYYVSEISSSSPFHSGFYKDTYGAIDHKEDYRLRCNSLVAVSLISEILELSHMKSHVENTEKYLIVSL